MQRYNSSGYIYNLELDEAFKLLLLGYKEKDKDRMYQEWLSIRENLKDNYKYDFNTYYNARLKPKKKDKVEVEKAKARIDKQVQKFRNKYDKKVGE